MVRTEFNVFQKHTSAVRFRTLKTSAKASIVGSNQSLATRFIRGERTEAAWFNLNSD